MKKNKRITFYVSAEENNKISKKFPDIQSGEFSSAVRKEIKKFIKDNRTIKKFEPIPMKNRAVKYSLPVSADLMFFVSSLSKKNNVKPSVVINFFIEKYLENLNIKKPVIEKKTEPKNTTKLSLTIIHEINEEIGISLRHTNSNISGTIKKYPAGRKYQMQGKISKNYLIRESIRFGQEINGKTPGLVKDGLKKTRNKLKQGYALEDHKEIGLIFACDDETLDMLSRLSDEAGGSRAHAIREVLLHGT